MNRLSKSNLCRLLGITRQKYYRSCWSLENKRKIADLVVSMVDNIRMSQPRIGTRKLYYLLQKELNNLNVGRDKLFDILRANHMLINPLRSYHVTTNSHHRFRKHKNIIADMEITRPEQVWVSDITYIGQRDNHMYLSLITDAYSKKIMGYDLSSSLGTEGSLRALKMAASNRRYPKNDLIHHSDRGVQYCSDIYQRALAKYKIETSMTESYDPYANAVAERINGVLKQEFLLEQYNVPLDVMKAVVKDVVEIYNKQRPHYSCGYLTPEQMHRQSERKIKTYKKTTHNGAYSIVCN